MNVIFIRHAESEYNRDGIWAGRADCSLTDKGIKAAQKLGETNDKDFDVIYCSPLKRTKQTLFAIFPEAKPIYDDRIIEISVGEWENTKKELYSNELRELFRKGLYTPPGGETHSDVDKRVCDFIEDVFEKFHGDEKILVVTHNGIMRAIKRNFMKKTNEIMSKNLGTLVLTEKDYRRYQEKQDFER